MEDTALEWTSQVSLICCRRSSCLLAPYLAYQWQNSCQAAILHRMTQHHRITQGFRQQLAFAIILQLWQLYTDVSSSRQLWQFHAEQTSVEFG